MPYSQAVLQRAEQRLEQARQQHDKETRARIADIYARYPRLKEIDAQLRKTAARVMAVSFRRGADTAAAMQTLKAENLALQQEREWLLESNDLDPDDLEPSPICPNCGGRGYVGAMMCDCLRELCRQEQKKELSRLIGTGRESFERFNLDLYPDKYEADLGSSPRVLMGKVLQTAQRYAKSFSPRSGSLLFIGPTGLGKTYLSACIARTVADHGFSVVYDTAAQLFADFEAAKFGKAADPALTGRYLNCDLLIIDDLGTEMTTQLVVASLYQVINTRLMAQRQTIISTNLPVGELERRYSAQIASRLLGVFEVCRFAGNDIRMMK